MSVKIKYAIIGVENVDYDGKNGHVRGVRLYVQEPIPSDKGSGFKVNNHFIRDANLSDYPLGNIVTLTYHQGFNGPICDGAIYA